MLQPVPPPLVQTLLGCARQRCPGPALCLTFSAVYWTQSFLVGRRLPAGPVPLAWGLCKNLSLKNVHSSASSGHRYTDTPIHLYTSDFRV